MTQKLNDITNLFHVDALSMVIMALVAFVALSIGSFSIRYLKGDRKQRHFFMHLVALVSVVFLMVSSDHIFLLLTFWGLSNYLLTRLMLHKTTVGGRKAVINFSLKEFCCRFYISRKWLTCTILHHRGNINTSNTHEIYRSPLDGAKRHVATNSCHDTISIMAIPQMADQFAKLPHSGISNYARRVGKRGRLFVGSLRTYINRPTYSPECCSNCRDCHRTAGYTLETHAK